MADFVNIDVFKFGTLFNIGIFWVEFDKFMCWSTFLNAWDYVDSGSVL